MGSEMCIRDRLQARRRRWRASLSVWTHDRLALDVVDGHIRLVICLLYTSDAADERSSVDLGGCRIIKKKK